VARFVIVGLEKGADVPDVCVIVEKSAVFVEADGRRDRDTKTAVIGPED